MNAGVCCKGVSLGSREGGGWEGLTVLYRPKKVTGINTVPASPAHIIQLTTPQKNSQEMKVVHLYLVCMAALTEADRPLYQLSLSALKSAAASGRLAHIRHALQDVGGFAVSGLGADYSAALKRLVATAPTCGEGAMEVTLADGTLRRSHVSTTQNPAAFSAAAAAFPDCVASDMAAISQTFDAVEAVMAEVLGRLLGNASLHVRLEDGRAMGLLDLPVKTHLHVYHAPTAAAVETQKQHSLPMHVDNGLYLLLTPDQSLPLLMRSKSGRAIRTRQVGPDAVLFLLGRGLTDWLVRDTMKADGEETAFTPALHAVPSLAKTGVAATRTVVARMKVAPLTAVPGTKPSAGQKMRRFGDLFLEGGVAPSAASLCYYGGPLTEKEADLRVRRSAAACWPHTEKC
jgi:hypothetical protein